MIKLSEVTEMTATKTDDVDIDEDMHALNLHLCDMFTRAGSGINSSNQRASLAFSFRGSQGLVEGLGCCLHAVAFVKKSDEGVATRPVRKGCCTAQATQQTQNPIPSTPGQGPAASMCIRLRKRLAPTEFVHAYAKYWHYTIARNGHDIE